MCYVIKRDCSVHKFLLGSIVAPLIPNLEQADYDILITNQNLEKGNLIVDSRVKVYRIFSVEKKLVKMDIGKINNLTCLKIKSILSSLLK
jgi:PemK-like, MazF-like toxin of type II toxin-antitoxin system